MPNIDYEEFLRLTEEFQLKRQRRINNLPLNKVKDTVESFVKNIRIKPTVDEKRRIKALKRKKQKCKKR